MAETSEARKRREALFSEPQWSPSEAVCCEMHGQVLTALRTVYGSSDMGEAVALADALEDQGLIRVSDVQREDVQPEVLFLPEHLAIVRFCAIECALQQSGERSVSWMLNAWTFAQTAMMRPLVVSDVLALGVYVEPHRNARGFRQVPVMIGGEVKDDWQNIPHQMGNLVAAVDDTTPEEWFRHYEEVHPFVDGNGRTGQVLYNFLRGTLHDPEWAPNYWLDPRRQIGSGAPDPTVVFGRTRGDQ